jgi:hypothetical protein
MDNVYQYLGKLMVRNTAIAHDPTGTATTVSTITSTSGNFLELTYDGQLAFSFTDLQPSYSTIHLDYAYNNSTLTAHIIDSVHETINGSTKTVDGYTRVPMTVMAVDTLHDTAYAFYPGLIWSKEDYTFTGDNNRIGDYLQLQSFSIYGANIYQNNNLVKSIKNSGYTKNMTYTMDAQSEITETDVSIVDSLGGTSSLVYKLQYQTY